MWDRAREQAEVQLAELRGLLDRYARLLHDPGASPDPLTAAPALGAILNSFYSGVENALKRILSETDGALPSGESWHVELLRSAAEPTSTRPAIISPATHDALVPYLRFRHLFRNAYAQWLDIEAMAPLGPRCRPTLEALEEDLHGFFEASR